MTLKELANKILTLPNAIQDQQAEVYLEGEGNVKIITGKFPGATVAELRGESEFLHPTKHHTPDPASM